MIMVTSSPPGVLTSERINVRLTEHRFPSLHFLWCVRILCFQWPMLCTVSKTRHGRVHRSSKITCPLFQLFHCPKKTFVVLHCNRDVWRKFDFTIHCVRYFLIRPVHKQMFEDISSAWAKEKKKLHFNKPSSAVSRVGGCAHWITTLLLLHSIKSDSSLEHGSWFDTFLLE